MFAGRKLWVYFSLTVALIGLMVLVAKTLVNQNSSSRIPASGLDISNTTTAWMQLGPQGDLIAKALAPGGNCPQATVDGVALSMQPRGATNEDFSSIACEAKVPSNAKTVTIGGVQLQRRAADPVKIVVLGDTGCRIKMKGSSVKSQECNDPNKWPFAKVAQAAANWQPDLVIHVGDYHYREAQCPSDNPDCAGATSGDNFASWSEDFFAPAAPLLRAAPWIFVRGNHESCTRGGNGWFRFLDPRSFTDTCVEKTEPYMTQFGDHFVGVIDAADDTNIPSSLSTLSNQVGTSFLWLALHRPFLTPNADDEATIPVTEESLAKLFDPSAATTKILNKTGSIFTGHMHYFSMNEFSDARPPEIISGNGGTSLEKANPVDTKYIVKDFADFGFLTLERLDGSNWKVVEHDINGQNIFECQLTETPGAKAKLSCSP
jgi:Calcineurin-like phosphoesterase